jgi:hypothetical protein
MLVYFGESIEVRGFDVVGSQFRFQCSGKDSFVFGKKFPNLPLNLRCRTLA